MDVSIFDFENIKNEIGEDPFVDGTTKYKEDSRFYKLAKDKDGKGAAIIRFLPDPEKRMIQKMFKINTTIEKNGKRRFVSEWSPSTIGLPCPFQEKWQELWNAGKKNEARLFSRNIRYIANIKVIKDPANPENEGKIFLFDMSGMLKDKIQNAVNPSEQDRALGATPKELFNPLRGHNFKLIARRGANGQITYDQSEVVSEVSSIYSSVEEAIKDIKNNCYKLSDLLKPEAFLPYEELKRKLHWVMFEDVNTPQQNVVEVQEPTQSQPVKVEQPEVQYAAQPVRPAAQTKETKSTSLDELLDGLI